VSLLHLTSYIPRIAFCASLAIAVSGCEERQRVDVEFVAGIVMMVHGMQLQRDHCSALFPADKQKYIREYEQSVVPRYAEVFDYQRTFEFDDQQSLLESLRMSEEESRLSCNEEYLESLKLFDSHYADYVDEVTAIVPKIEEAAKKAATHRAQEWANPSGVQNEPLFSAIVDSLNRSFLSGDWSILANLYGDGAFDCWNNDGHETNFSFLAKPPVPLDARHEIRAGPVAGPPFPRALLHFCP